MYLLDNLGAEVVRDWVITRSNSTPQAKILLLLGLAVALSKTALCYKAWV